jgi:DNA-binding MarR family transcriptional regulator
MAKPIEVAELLGCRCARLRETTRKVTQLYDHALAACGLTINQFSLLARLYGAQRAGRNAVPIGVLAERLGMDPTTLTRNLKPLEARRLVASAADAEDRRVRAVRLTPTGTARLTAAVPHWRKAQAMLETALGRDATRALDGALDASLARLPR